VTAIHWCTSTARGQSSRSTGADWFDMTSNDADSQEATVNTEYSISLHESCMSWLNWMPVWYAFINVSIDCRKLGMGNQKIAVLFSHCPNYCLNDISRFQSSLVCLCYVNTDRITSTSLSHSYATVNRVLFEAAANWWLHYLLQWTSLITLQVSSYDDILGDKRISKTIDMWYSKFSVRSRFESQKQLLSLISDSLSYNHQLHPCTSNCIRQR
jgi:hypothetical protein